jgi:hypothetical protein
MDSTLRVYDSNGTQLSSVGTGIGRKWSSGAFGEGKIIWKNRTKVACFSVGGGGPVVTKPGVTTNDASNVTANSARLNGQVTSTGGENPTVKIYWGNNDGGTGTWDNVEDLGTKGTGTFYKNVTTLTAGTTYYFRCYAENTAGGTWASSSKSFTTLASIQKPAVTTKAATSVTAVSARLNGEVTSTGGENPTVKIYWGDNDGGTGTWDNVEDLGTKGTGTFYKDVTGLTAGTTYYFRCYAENSAGGTWASASQSFTPTAPVGGLVGHWEFDDGGGSMATDSSAKGNDGAVNGATWTTGIIGGALSFTGTDSDYVQIPNESDYDLASAVSYAVWIKAGRSSISWMGVITKANHMNLQRYGTEDYLVWQTKAGTITNYQLKANTAVLDDQWHHIAVTYDGSQKCIYADGVLDNSVPATGTINTTDTPVMIGKNGQVPGHAFDGVIDDVRIYDYALTAAEVQTLYDMGSGGPAPSGPTITQHPGSVIVTEGDPASFTVAATGTGTLSYQWYEDAAKVAGANSATYTISSTTLAHDGHRFHCVVTDDYGSAQSSSATLTVNAFAVDTDNDGLPDIWELLYGLDPTSAVGDDGASGDPDGDGYTNLEEYLGYSDPNDKTSVPGGGNGGSGWGLACVAGAAAGGGLVALLALGLMAIRAGRRSSLR